MAGRPQVLRPDPQACGFVARCWRACGEPGTLRGFLKLTGHTKAALRRDALGCNTCGLAWLPH